MIVTATGGFSKREIQQLLESNTIDVEQEKLRIFADVLVQSKEFSEILSNAERKRFPDPFDNDRYRETFSLLVSNVTYEEIVALANAMEEHFPCNILAKHKITINKLIK